MAKAAKIVKANLKDQELNRWCIEMAIKWPVHSQSGYSTMGAGAYGGAGQVIPPVHKDEDVVGRAAKIFEWVTSKH